MALEQSLEEPKISDVRQAECDDNFSSHSVCFFYVGQCNPSESFPISLDDDFS